MASEIVITLVGLFCTTVSSIVTFILTRRKYNTEVDSQQIENMEKSFDAYKKMMEESMKVQNQRIDALQKENDNLRKQVYDLQQQLITMAGRFISTGVPSPSFGTPSLEPPFKPSC